MSKITFEIDILDSQTLRSDDLFFFIEYESTINYRRSSKKINIGLIEFKVNLKM